MHPQATVAQVEAGLGASVPPELFPLIIEHMDHEDYLKACCLVSRTWCKFAQPRIYARLSLSTESQCVAWDDKFNAYPHLATAVTSLYFWGSGIRKLDVDSDDSDEDSVEGGCVLNNDAIRHLLPKLQNIVDLEIEGFSWWHAEDLPALLILSKDIRSLAISSTMLKSDYLLELVHSMPHLESLAFSYIDIEIELEDPTRVLRGTGDFLIHSDSGFRAAAPQQLHSITLDRVQRQADLIMWLTSPRFDLTGLSRADLSWHFHPDSITGPIRGREPQFPPLDRLLSFCRPCVTDLALSLHPRYPGQLRPSGSPADPCLGRFLCSVYLRYPDAYT